MTLILSIALWGVIHSITASLPVKNAVRGLVGEAGTRYYRLVYNIFSVISFLPILWLLTALPDRPLYEFPPPWKFLMLGGQGLAAIFLIAGVLQTGALNFVGLRQLLAGEKSGRLVTNGLYRYVRHPLYTFGLLLLWLTPSVSINMFTAYIGLTFYLILGAYFEERKLNREFGHAYSEYKKATPMFIPGFKFVRKNNA